MSKKILLVACVLLLTFFSAQAQMRMTVGLSGFMAQYTLTDDESEDVFTTNSGILIGPYLSIASDRLNLGASMYFGSFPVTEVYGLDVEDFDLSINRKDLNLSLGYALIRNSSITISPFIGLKYFTWNLSSEDFDIELDRTGTMVGGGLQGVLRFSPNSGLYLYGSGALLGGSINTTSDGEESDVSSATVLIALNAGIGFRMPNTPLGVNVGFRGDLFGSAESTSDEFGAEDTVSYTESVVGLVATVSWTF